MSLLPEANRIRKQEKKQTTIIVTERKGESQTGNLLPEAKRVVGGGRRTIRLSGDYELGMLLPEARGFVNTQVLKVIRFYEGYKKKKLQEKNLHLSKKAKTQKPQKTKRISESTNTKSDYNKLLQRRQSELHKLYRENKGGM